MNYLIFQLYGPMVSWGEIAVGESRHTGVFPTKSTVLGLIAGSLGLLRSEDEKHLSLNRLQMAAQVMGRGSLLRDFHTVQVPDSAGNRKYLTRRDELISGKDRVGTLLSSRDYRTDFYAQVAFCDKEAGCRFTLDVIKQALERPKFMPYLGRKSCPIGIPSAPQVISAGGFRSAFDLYQRKSMLSLSQVQRGIKKVTEDKWVVMENERLGISNDRYFYWEGALDDFDKTENFAASHVSTVQLRDETISRDRWQFKNRSIHCYHLKMES